MSKTVYVSRDIDSGVSNIPFHFKVDFKETDKGTCVGVEGSVTVTVQTKSRDSKTKKILQYIYLIILYIINPNKVNLFM